MNRQALWAWSALEIRDAVRCKAISATEVVTAHLDRINAINPQINAIVTLVPELALAQAHAVDAAIGRGETLGPLAGVPVAHKDLTLTQGIRTTFGSQLFADFVPTQDAEIVARMKAAGAVTLGKTNTPEWGAGSQTFNDIFGVTRNPYDRSKTAGGSSGGAAAALAARLVPLCDGTDLGGSLRNPASFCNVVGFRTTPGRVPIVPSENPEDPLPIVGPMARTVDDCALLLNVISGAHERAPLSKLTEQSFEPPVKAGAGALKIAFSADFSGQIPVDPEVVDCINGTRDFFNELGCEVIDYCPDLSGANDTFHILRASSFARRHGKGVRRNPRDYKQTIVWNVEAGLALTKPDIHRALQQQAMLIERFRVFFEHYDFLVTPVVQVAPFDAALEYVTEIAGQPMQTYIEWMQSCSIFSVTGLPALSLPAGFTSLGLPVGLQIIGKPRADLAVLQLAKAFETINPIWQRAPVF